MARRYRPGRCQPWIRWCHLEPGGCRPLVGTLHRSRRAWPGATALVGATLNLVGADRCSACFTVLAGHGPALPPW